MNTITKEQIEAIMEASTFEVSTAGKKTTVVCATLPNGFEITESSACVDPANYDVDTGVKICKERIINRVWQLEGYCLQCDLGAKVTVDPIEALAEYAHDAWSGWMNYLLSKSKVNDDGTWTIPAQSTERWYRQMTTPYFLLPENEKTSDRAEAEAAQRRRNAHSAVSVLVEAAEMPPVDVATKQSRRGGGKR